MNVNIFWPLILNSIVFSKLVVEYDSFVVEERPGEQWIRLKKKFGEKEEIKIEVTMFDGSIPVEKSPDGIRIGQEVELHITLIVNISKGEGSDVLEFVCSAWPQSVEIVNVLVHGKDGRPNQLYMSPKFKYDIYYYYYF